MFAFKFDKALQATAYLLRREPTRQMNYMRLLKVLYTADREGIRRTGRPITGGEVAAMERGPVLSKMLDLIKGTDLRSPDWSKFIERNEYDIRLVQDPGQGRLSRYEIELLEQVAEDHRADDEWAMVEFTHTFQEWRKNDPGKLMKWIPFHDILEAVGRQADEADIEEDAKTDRAFAQLFGD
jgi:uncharacterized phage-associated protein